MTRLTIVTGLSGSGKSVALHTLEDEGFYCIDNLPGYLLLEVIDKILDSGLDLYEKLAIGIDMRSERRSATNLTRLIDTLRTRSNLKTDVLYLDTNRNTLVTRFSETRRRHPLSSKDLTLISAIDQEMRLLETVKADADLVIDTSALTLHDLRDMIRTHLLGNTSKGLSLIFQSFGFKHGSPASTDFMFDVRCLPNPHWDPELRPYTGRDPQIVQFLESKPDVDSMYQHIRSFLVQWLPSFEAENRSYLTVSIGCTGGRHRSVYLTERLAESFKADKDDVSIRHRELS